jgi:hypothetical protein
MLKRFYIFVLDRNFRFADKTVIFHDHDVPTVEKRAKTRVFVPFLNTLALQISDMSSVASNTPKAPPLKI